MSNVDRIAPDWAKWQHIPEVILWEGVALSLGIEPRPAQGTDVNLDGEYTDRVLIASRNLGNHESLSLITNVVDDPVSCTVSLAGFASWACSLDWEVPRQFREIGEQWTGPPEADKPAATKWPWGDYETELLRKLNDAARNFWSTYEPDDKSTAPKTREVVEWLQTQDVSRRAAESIAHILRADDLPTGPRK